MGQICYDDKPFKLLTIFLSKMLGAMRSDGTIIILVVKEREDKHEYVYTHPLPPARLNS
jgi:hypothetical protein